MWPGSTAVNAGLAHAWVEQASEGQLESCKQRQQQQLLPANDLTGCCMQARCRGASPAAAAAAAWIVGWGCAARCPQRLRSRSGPAWQQQLQLAGVQPA